MRRAHDKFKALFTQDLEGLDTEKYEEDEEIRGLREVISVERDANEAQRAAARRR
jgi:hypothetical protein